MGALHKRKQQMSEQELQEQLEQRLTKEERNNSALTDQVRDILKNSNPKYAAQQIQDAKLKMSDSSSDLNRAGDNNNFKKGNERFAAQKASAEILQAEDKSEETKFENTHKHDGPEWTQLASQEAQVEKEKQDEAAATASWTQQAKHAPSPEPTSTDKQRPEPAPGSTLPDPTKIPEYRRD